MTDSQMIFLISIAAVCLWGPILALLWFFTSGDKGPSPWGALRTDLNDGLKVLFQKWPDLKLGQKHFMMAASFLSSALVLFVSWGGSMTAEWILITFGGMAPQEAAIPPPLGSWTTIWFIQMALTVCFYVWLEFWPKKNIGQ